MSLADDVLSGKVMPQSANAVARIFGLPVYTSKWLPEEMIIMADRPYSKLTDSELSRVFTEQLQVGARLDPVEVTAYGDTKRSFLVPQNYTSNNTTTTLTTSPYFSNSTVLWSDPLFATEQPKVETVFRVGSDGRPEAVTKLVSKPMADSVRNAGETDMAWLKRRVAEVCWTPA